MPETRFRRFMMQSIMWMILGGTVGLAALLDRARSRDGGVGLSEPKMFDSFTVRLPKGWEQKASSFEGTTRVVLTDPQGDKIMTITARPPSPADRRRSARRGNTVLDQIDFGGAQADLVLRQVGFQEPQFELSAVRPLGADRVLAITLAIDIGGTGDSLDPEVELIRQVAASVKIDAAENSPKPTSDVQ